MGWKGGVVWGLIKFEVNVVEETSPFPEHPPPCNHEPTGMLRTFPCHSLPIPLIFPGVANSEWAAEGRHIPHKKKSLRKWGVKPTRALRTLRPSGCDDDSRGQQNLVRERLGFSPEAFLHHTLLLSAAQDPRIRSRTQNSRHSINYLCLFFFQRSNNPRGPSR